MLNYMQGWGDKPRQVSKQTSKQNSPKALFRENFPRAWINAEISYVPDSN